MMSPARHERRLSPTHRSTTRWSSAPGPLAREEKSGNCAGESAPSSCLAKVDPINRRDAGQARAVGGATRGQQVGEFSRRATGEPSVYGAQRRRESSVRSTARTMTSSGDRLRPSGRTVATGTRGPRRWSWTRPVRGPLRFARGPTSPTEALKFAPTAALGGVGPARRDAKISAEVGAA